MQISNRTKDIIEIILNKKDYITTLEITESLKISQRTLYRELPDVKKIMERFGITLEKESRKGICAYGSQEAFDALRCEINIEGEVLLIDQRLRSHYILLYLLHEEDFVKSEAIALDHNCALSTVRSDLKDMVNRISTYDLRILQQKGQGVRIVGSRVEKNQLMTRILLDSVDENLLYKWMQGDIVSDPFLNRMEEYGYRNTFIQMNLNLKFIVENNRKEFGLIRTSDYIEFVFLMGFLVYQHNIGNPYHRYMDAKLEQKEQIQLLNSVMNKVSSVYDISFSEEEQSYIQWITLIVFGEKGAVLTIQNNVLNKDIMDFIKYVEKRIGVYILMSNELKEGLYIHMDKALLRIRSNMQIVNPMLREIKKEYSDLFNIIKSGVREIFINDYFPDDEIAYLVLYFAVAIDKMSCELFEVIVVCSGGMGSSKMLAALIEREIPEIKVVKTASIVTLGNENIHNYDLVLSTIPLPLEEDEYVRVSPLLHKNEITLIREKIKRHRHNKLRLIDSKEKKQAIIGKKGNQELIQKVCDISEFTLKILDSFTLVEKESFIGLKNSLCDYLNKDVTMIEKPKEYHFIIPTTNIMYYECISESINDPIFVIHFYKNKAILDDEFLASISIAYSANLKSGEYKILKFFIQSFFEDSDVMNYILEKKTDDIKEWIATKCGEYINNLFEC